MSRSPDERGSRSVLVPIVIAAIVILLYSVLIAGQLFAGMSVLISLFLVYLAYRFVRAHERIADALESGNSEGRTDLDNERR